MKCLKKLGIWCLLIWTLLAAAGCGKTEKKSGEAPSPVPKTEEAEKLPETEEPVLSYLDTVQQAIEQKDRQTLYQELRYWDGEADKSGKFSMEMIDAFLEDISQSPEKIREFMALVEDEFYEEDKQQITLPAVYIVVTSSTDNTRLSLPVFGERVIENAKQKGQKLGPMLPMSYTITASNDSWEKERTQKIDVSLKELTAEKTEGVSDQQSAAGKHTYYVNFQNSPDKSEPPVTGAESKQPSGRIVAIDPGHQAKANNEQEPVGPGASETKPKVASGTAGCVSGLAEYELTLMVSQKLRDVLQQRGYQVVMIRETNDVNISNRERAEIANNSGADIFVRIHADGSESSSPRGCSTLYPGSDNSYVSGISSASGRLSEEIVNHLSAKTGFVNRGAVVRDDMSGINWCKIPVSIVEMGFMTNPEEDAAMASDSCQQQIAEGIADGIDAYFQ